MNQKFVGLFVRLLTTDCRSETATALKYEGASALETSFAVLGQVAGRDLMTHPNVTSAMQSLGADLDKTQFKQLLEEAGVPH